MAVNGDSCIYRLTSSGQTESSINDKIEFNGGIVPDAKNFVTNTEFEMRRALGKQPRLKTTRSHKIVDSGFEGITLTINGVIRHPDLQIAEFRAKTWLIEDQSNTSFPFGRFGLRLNDNPAFNIFPNSLRGYYLESFRFIRPGSHKGKLQFIGVVRFDGDVGSPNGSGFYVW